jgi:hypothetical protein
MGPEAEKCKPTLAHRVRVPHISSASGDSWQEDTMITDLAFARHVYSQLEPRASLVTWRGFLARMERERLISPTEAAEWGELGPDDEGEYLDDIYSGECEARCGSEHRP